MTGELYACIYAREFSAQALLRLRPELTGKPVVVLAGDPPRDLVWSANPAAYTRGVRLGMTQVELEALTPVTLLHRSAAAEDSARQALLECVRNFSPRVQELPEESACAFTADIKGTEKLLGDPRTASRAIVQQAAIVGFRVSVAVAGNVFAALCCARGREGITVVARGEEQQVLASLPLSVLHLTPEDEELFALWGIRTLGSLSNLPEKELVARLGQRGQRLRQLACGEYPHLLVPQEDDLLLEERVELDCGLESLDSVLFVVSPMLQQLVVRARARALALAALILTCSLEGGEKHRRTIRPTLPTTDHAVLLKLLRLDLIQHPPSAAVLGLGLQAEAARPTRVQLGLFAPQFPEPMRLEVMLARLSAIVGTERVGAPELKDSHAPEAFSITRFTSPREIDQTARPARHHVAARVLRPAERVNVELYRDRPLSLAFRNQHYRVLHAYGPWIRSGEWWKPERWSAEEWDLVAISSVSEELSCKLAHDLVNDCWKIEAIYD